MKKLLAVSCSLLATAVVAGEFPYGTEMTVRHSADSAEVSSFENPVEVPAVNGGMPMTDSVATLCASVVDFCASDEENWTVGTNAVGTVQAALTLRLVDGVCKWMGYTGGEWCEFAAEGAPAADGVWEVRIEIDYSLGAGSERIRYSVGKTGAELVPLARIGGGEWVALGNSQAGVDRKIERVRLYGAGETGLVEAKSGARSASGAIAVTPDFGAKYDRLALDVTVTDAWGVDAVSVVLTDAAGNAQTNSAALPADGTAKVVFTEGIEKGETYGYEVFLTGSCRGKDLAYADDPREVLIGIRTDWFAFGDGAFTNATPDANVTLSGKALSAAAVSPRGIVLPDSAAPQGTIGITLDAALIVAGAVQEPALATLDAASAVGALTVVRFSDGERDWACKTANGWTRLSGAAATNGTYDVRMTLDYKDGRKRIAYSVKGDGESVTLADAQGNAWFDLPAGSKVMRKASLLGGNVSSLAAVCKSVPIVKRGIVIFVH